MAIEPLQELEWSVFEKVTAEYFQMKGMEAELTGHGAGGGVDVKVRPEQQISSTQSSFSAKPHDKR